jgi:pyridoxine/pyridoxamine 5'-phosphate oxidase
MTDLAALARSIVDDNVYMVLGTADAQGQPWVSPVWFAHDGYREFVWVSAPDAQHSRNIAERDIVSIVIFDSRVKPGSADALYVTAFAMELEDDDQDRALEVFNARGTAQGLKTWALADVRPPARLRLYRATGFAFSVLDPDATIDVRAAVDL